MNRIVSLLATVALTAALSTPVLAEKKKRGAGKEKNFVSLFDGTSTDQWMNAKSGKFPEKGWVIEDGCLKHVAKGGGGDIITRGKYEQFDFRFEWKVAKGANSGVKYFIIRERGSLGHEYQVLDDENHPDGAKGANRQTAAFYDVLDPAKDKPLKSVGEFNSSRILVKGKTVKHFLNGRPCCPISWGATNSRLPLPRVNSKTSKCSGSAWPGTFCFRIMEMPFGIEISVFAISARNRFHKRIKKHTERSVCFFCAAALFLWLIPQAKRVV